MIQFHTCFLGVYVRSFVSHSKFYFQVLNDVIDRGLKYNTNNIPSLTGIKCLYATVLQMLFRK